MFDVISQHPSNQLKGPANEMFFGLGYRTLASLLWHTIDWCRAGPAAGGLLCWDKPNFSRDSGETSEWIGT